MTSLTPRVITTQMCRVFKRCYVAIIRMDSEIKYMIQTITIYYYYKKKKRYTQKFFGLCIINGKLNSRENGILLVERCGGIAVMNNECAQSVVWSEERYFFTLWTYCKHSIKSTLVSFLKVYNILYCSFSYL